MKPRKVMIIGAGNVGTAAAHAFVNQKFVEELILVDLNKERVEGNRKDLADAAAFMLVKWILLFVMRAIVQM